MREKRDPSYARERLTEWGGRLAFTIANPRGTLNDGATIEVWALPTHTVLLYVYAGSKGWDVYRAPETTDADAALGWAGEPPERD